MERTISIINSFINLIKLEHHFNSHCEGAYENIYIYIYIYQMKLFIKSNRMVHV